MIQYKVIVDRDIDEFERIVSNHLNAGWKCLGGMNQVLARNLFNQNTYVFAQTMLWEDENYTQPMQNAKQPIESATQTDQDKLAA